MPRKGKKHQILGGVKVSSSQLSEWGKGGGRPQKWKNEAERKRAERLRKKQLEHGKGASLRNYKSYEEQPSSSFIKLICSNCQAKSIGSLRHLGEQCGGCFLGRMVKDSSNISQRAGSGRERWERWREKGEIINKKQECQHD